MPLTDQHTTQVSRLDFVLPMFIRIAWVNDSAREIWEHLIHTGQQFHIAAGVALGEAMPLVDGDLDLSALPMPLDQPGQLRSAQPGHLLRVPSRQAAHMLAPYL